MAKNKVKDLKSSEDEFIENEREPIRKAFTIERVKDGWSFVIIHYQYGKIVDIDRTEPDLKALTLEKLKIALVKYWSSIG